jgi:hypothetical protein
MAHAPVRLGKPVECLGAGRFLQDMPIDEHQVPPIIEPLDQMSVPDFIECRQVRRFWHYVSSGHRFGPADPPSNCRFDQ